MKKIPLRVAFTLIAVLAAVMPVMPDEPGTTETQERRTQQKDECLLTARQCGTTIISIQDKIERLKEEIAKGRAVYTREELNNLQQKLNDVSRTLDFLLDKK